MKTIKTAGKLLFITSLIFLLSGVFNLSNAQNGRNNRRQAQVNDYLSIPNLTDYQKKVIKAKTDSHKADMDILRDKRRNTSSRSEKAEIREQMNLKIENHKKEIRSLLDAKQQQYFDENCNKSKFRQNNGKRNGKGMGNGNRRSGRGRF